MQGRADGESPTDRVAADEPQSFAIHGATVETAWGQLDQLISVASAGASETGGDALLKLAQAIIEARRVRTHDLPPAIFGEPAWDMLLTLFADARSRQGETVSNLGLSSGTPATTALRWIDYLEREAFVIRRPSPTDKRVVLIELTDKARNALGVYLTKVIDKRILAAPQS